MIDSLQKDAIEAKEVRKLAPNTATREHNRVMRDLWRVNLAGTSIRERCVSLCYITVLSSTRVFRKRFNHVQGLEELLFQKVSVRRGRLFQ